MTNPATPTPSKGGMPKWLIILLIVLIVIIMGCCGGLTTCFFLAKRAAKAASDPATWQNIQKQIEDGQRDAINRAAAEQAAANAGNAPATPPSAPTPPGDNGVPTLPNTPVPPSAPVAPSADSGAAAVKLPSTFPTDIPLEPGLTLAVPTWDNMAGTGAMILKGTVKPEDAVSYYTANMPKNGWTQSVNQSFGTTTMLQYTKDTRKVTVEVMAADNNGGTNVMMAVEKK